MIQLVTTSIEHQSFSIHMSTAIDPKLEFHFPAHKKNKLEVGADVSLCYASHFSFVTRRRS